MTITRNLTLEQQLQNSFSYIQELYPEIDLKSIYPLSVNFPDSEPLDADGYGRFQVTFQFGYWQDPAKPSEEPKNGRKMFNPGKT